MTKQEIQQVFEKFNRLKVLVVGDVMIDAYVWGNVSRISPEAPVPIVAVSKKENRLGGAANVALNVKSLGATPIICSVVGLDEQAEQFSALLHTQQLSDKGILKSKTRTTTVKTRIIGNNHQMLRVDEEMLQAIDTAEEKMLFDRICELALAEKADAIIFEDYDKGCLTPSLIRAITEFAKQHNIPTAADPKKNNFLQYHNITLFKPNLRELKEGLKAEFDHTNLQELTKYTDKLQQLLKAEMALITLSELGVYISYSGKHQLFQAHVRNIADVSGAGDTVISVAALCLALKTQPEFMAALANLAGGLVCEKVGVVSIDKEELLQEAIALL